MCQLIQSRPERCGLLLHSNVKLPTRSDNQLQSSGTTGHSSVSLVSRVGVIDAESTAKSRNNGLPATGCRHICRVHFSQWVFTGCQIETVCG
jgi:hypothetical protein